MLVVGSDSVAITQSSPPTPAEKYKENRISQIAICRADHKARL